MYFLYATLRSYPLLDTHVRSYPRRSGLLILNALMLIFTLENVCITVFLHGRFNEADHVSRLTSCTA